MVVAQLSACPACGGPLTVVRLHCRSCGTSVEGQFESDPLMRLALEQRQFVLLFLRARGNIRELERELGVSYPTVRSRLDAVIAGLGLGPTVEVPEPPVDSGRDERRAVLESLARGDITAAEALRRLQEPS